MPITNIQRLLDRLDEIKTRFADGDAAIIIKTIAVLASEEFTDAESLLRFHELLLFIRAYPANVVVVRAAEKQLKTFAGRVKTLLEADVDSSPLEHPDASGVAGTSVIDTFSYPIVRWLVRQRTGPLSLSWDWFEDENRLAQTWPRFFPLLAEDSSVEANVPYAEWLRRARGREAELGWLIKRYEALPISDVHKTELFDSQKLYVSWTPPYRVTRTGMRLPRREFFYHREPFIQRRDISLKRELDSRPPKLTKLSLRDGTALLAMARAASTVRYRELYGFTHGDPGKVLKADLGRGVELFVVSLPPGRRLPLRAYHAAMIFKNGVPVGYFEGLSLFEKMESGFNFYYGFREGETAWIYARTLNVFHHMLGVTAFSLDPYQIGFENEEGIASGAFWFYRKLGFRPTNKQIAKLTAAEEKKITERTRYRTPARTLRKLAAGSMIWEPGQATSGAWDQFQVRNIGFKAQSVMAARFGGDPERIREHSLRLITSWLALNLRKRSSVERAALSDVALALALIPNLDRWSGSEKELLVEVLRAKVTGDEARYLKLMQRHERFRQAMIRLGS